MSNYKQSHRVFAAFNGTAATSVTTLPVNRAGFARIASHATVLTTTAATITITLESSATEGGSYATVDGFTPIVVTGGAAADDVVSVSAPLKDYPGAAQWVRFRFGASTGNLNASILGELLEGDKDTRFTTAGDAGTFGSSADAGQQPVTIDARGIYQTAS
jgi:hypothetical protein